MQEIPYLSVIANGNEDVTLFVSLIIAAIALAILVWMISTRTEKKLRVKEQPKEARQSNGHPPASLPGRSGYLNELKRDFSPRSWLSRFSQDSIKHLLVMSFFYHAVGIGLGTLGTGLIASMDSTYEEPVVPFSLVDALAAGPIEETLAFGIPFYVSGNHFVLLVSGSIWALGHILNTDVYTLGTLAYGNVLFAIPHIFLSIRTWASGKGWFAIVFHSGWNGMAFGISCGLGEIPCAVFPSGGQLFLGTSFFTLVTIIAAEILLLITYLLYRRKRNMAETDYSRGPMSIPPLTIFNTGPYAATVSSTETTWRRPSKAWYLLPALGIIEGLVGIIAGIIMYCALRKRDPRMAKNGLILGILLFIAKLAISIGATFLGF